MNYRMIGFTAFFVLSLTAAETNTRKSGSGIPRTPDGHPSFEGIWTNVTLTPLERPKDLASKEFFTPAEAAAYEKGAKLNRDKREPGTEADVALAYNDFWWDSGTKVVKTLRTSIVIDPPDGRVPPLTAERQKQLAAVAEKRKARCQQQQPGCEEGTGALAAVKGPADGPEDRTLSERCLSFSNAAPMTPTVYNNTFQFVQSRNTLAIDVELGHNVRRIALDGGPHLPPNVREWLGDSRGRWEGDTLVIDTTNFGPTASFRGSDENLHLIERLTRVDQDTILYRFTIDDPTAFTKPWTGEIPMVKAQGELYEYACHEGNLGLAGILAAAREDEKKAAEAASRKQASQ